MSESLHRDPGKPSSVGGPVPKLLLDQHTKRHKDPFPATDPWTQPPMLSEEAASFSQGKLFQQEFKAPKTWRPSWTPLPLSTFQATARCQAGRPCTPAGPPCHSGHNCPESAPLSSTHTTPGGLFLPQVSRKGLLISTAPPPTSQSRGALPQPGVSGALMKTRQNSCLP